VTKARDRRVLSVIVCGAGPATVISTLITLAHGRGWIVQIIATPAALEFFDQAAVEEQTGSPVKSQYSKPGTPRSQIPDAIVVAPATYNTINKWAQGISDTYALGVLAELTSLDIAIVVLPSSTPRSPAASHSARASTHCARKEYGFSSAQAASNRIPRAPAAA
jgi:hypothetical protein